MTTTILSNNERVQKISIVSAGPGIEYVLSNSQPTVTPSPSPGDVLLWVWENHGTDSEDVSRHFEISGFEAAHLVKDLLARGLLDFAE